MANTTVATEDGFSASTVPFTIIRLKNIGKPTPFSQLKASLYGTFIYTGEVFN